MSGYEERRPIAWIVATVEQLTRESGLARTADIEDLVILAYVGQLDSPDPHALSLVRLLARCRSELVTWAWEQGQHEEEISTRDRANVRAGRRAVGAPCGALLSRSA